MQVNEQSIQASARLCDAIKWHPCLYDSKSKVFQMKHAVDAAWRSIANLCEDTVANCKYRWRIIRKSFAISVRKYGQKNKHYLQEYLAFLVPHVSAINLNEDNAADVIQLEEDPDDYERDESDDEEEHEDDDEVEDDEVEDDEEHEDQDDEEDERHKEDDLSGDHESETTSADETLKDKASDKVKKLRKIASNVATPDVEDDGDELNTGSQTDDGPARGRRIMRMRRATKRYLESGLYEGRKKERQEEKRARHSIESKKSTSSPALEEYEKRKSTTNLTNKRVEVKLVKTKLSEPAPEPKKLKPDSTDKLKSASPEKVRIVFAKPEKSLAVKDIIAKPTMMDSSTTAADTAKKCVNRGTQCDSEMPKTMDEEFLDTIKPQMDLMNSRQKFNFKKRVFQALMDVFDDATNFPNKNEIVQLPSTGAPRFDTTTVGELRLMRELVHIVQAAKSTPEIMNANEKVTAVPLENRSAPTPPPSTSTDKHSSHTTTIVTAERKTNSPISVGNSKRSETLGLPRHILQKVVKVAGSSGGTILAHEGEKRRVYRIYPKGTLPASVANSSASNSATIGTFYVTPPKTTTAASHAQTKTSTPGGNVLNGKPIVFNGKVVNHLNANTTISTSAVLPTNPNKTQTSSTIINSNNAMSRHKVTVRTQVANTTITQRRLSQSGSANGGSTPVLQNKNVTSTNPQAAVQQKSTPTIIKTVQRVAWDEAQKPTASSSGLSQIQISQPVSLNASATSNASVKAFLESGGDTEAPGETSPNTILPDAGIVDEDDEAGIITSDGYDPLFIKTVIKDEPNE